MEKPHIRPFRDEDLETTAEIFFKAVRSGTKDHYDDEQRVAWAPESPSREVWQKRMAGQTVFVAKIRSEIVGFMSLTEAGLIDLAFVHPDYLGQGVADALYKSILDAARSQGLSQLTTEASHQARRFFGRHGWQIEAEQAVSRNGVELTNFRMTLNLGG